MKLKIIFFAMLLLVVSTPAFAEFYQYTDEAGNLRFTDNIGDVPADQRPKIKRYHELAPEVTPGGKTAGSGGEEEKSVKAEKPVENIRQSAEILAGEKKELDLEFDALQKEKEALLKPPGKDAPRKEVKAYAKKVKELNGRIKAYEKKRTAFKKKADAFETRVKASRKKHAGFPAR